jgi:hypothetical protein
LYVPQSNINNVTLCPVVDLANHISDITRATTKSPTRAFYSPPVLLKAESEVFLKYGNHSNRVLFVEYGFVEENSYDGAEADAQDIVESLLNDLGDLGKWIEHVLKSNNFWGYFCSFYLGRHCNSRVYPRLLLVTGSFMTPQHRHSLLTDFFLPFGSLNYQNIY